MLTKANLKYLGMFYEIYLFYSLRFIDTFLNIIPDPGENRLLNNIQLGAIASIYTLMDCEIENNDTEICRTLLFVDHNYFLQTKFADKPKIVQRNITYERNYGFFINK